MRLNELQIKYLSAADKPIAIDKVFAPRSVTEALPESVHPLITKHLQSVMKLTFFYPLYAQAQKFGVKEK